MVFILQDDNCIHSYASADEAARAIEPIDVHQVIRAAFDDAGRSLSVRWIERPKTQGFWVGGGRYELLASARPDVPRFREFIASAVASPPEVHHVLKKLTSAG